jgi:hypothetical protein
MRFAPNARGPEGPLRLNPSGKSGSPLPDEELVLWLAHWASNKFQEEWSPELDFPGRTGDIECDALLLAPWSVYTYQVRGRSIAGHMLQQYGRILLPTTRLWLEAQEQAWLSMWGVRAVTPGKCIELIDVLTGATRTVEEGYYAGRLRPEELILARVIEFDGRAILGGIHGYAHHGVAAVMAIADAHDRLGIPVGSEPVPATRLRGTAASRALICAWESAARLRAA